MFIYTRVDTTADMSAGECQVWLTKFAERVEKSGRSRVLIDSTTFRMSPANMDGPWRDAYITPRYNAAGVAKFAFHMPEGMPMIGKPPPPDGPGRFPTGYFARPCAPRLRDQSAHSNPFEFERWRRWRSRGERGRRGPAPPATRTAPTCSFLRSASARGAGPPQD